MTAWLRPVEPDSWNSNVKKKTRRLTLNYSIISNSWRVSWTDDGLAKLQLTVICGTALTTHWSLQYWLLTFTVCRDWTVSGTTLTLVSVKHSPASRSGTLPVGAKIIMYVWNNLFQNKSTFFNRSGSCSTSQYGAIYGIFCVLHHISTKKYVINIMTKLYSNLVHLLNYYTWLQFRATLLE